MGFGYILSHDVVLTFGDTFSPFPIFRLDNIGTGISFTGHNAGFEVRYPRGFICVPTNCSLVRHDVGKECQMKIFTLSIFA
ncbi:hypothetical protein pdam_00017649 [Pocillopora damicornis]|uniref:Uncharacterized protein n=1 Tax=Pocillopora damicornis TaxID=46731 RepID=A0A3M6U732_POCDA|nr:hypothetical protein pdam_00017649 [Pocillopora damicornis]